jgi:molybdenum cofactor cytidylyltransferase
MAMRRSRVGFRPRGNGSPDRPRRSVIGLVLLAAGASTRMRQAKQALPIASRDGVAMSESLLRHAARAAVEAGTRPVVIVLGAAADDLVPQLNGLPLHVVAHSGWERGIGSSIKVGLECLLALSPAVDGVILSVCDQPHLTSSVFTRLGRAYRGSDATVVASAYAGVAGVPALFDRSVFAELQALRDDEGARTLIDRDELRLATVPFPRGSIDLDTPEAYEAYLRAAESSR